jgi:glyoxylase-like metal-dependent hydrolase (beta-lactamase superfamily II)
VDRLEAMSTFEAGLGADPDLNLPRSGRLIQRLEAAGIDLASVTDVVLIHLHIDHIGGPLVDGVSDAGRRCARRGMRAAGIRKRSQFQTL